jgi:biotin synthase
MRYKTGVAEYPLKERDEMKEKALFAKEIGAERFGIVTSGGSLSPKEIDAICEAISEIEREISVCASLGRLDRAQLSALRSAGLKRYHHNIETSERNFPNVVTTHTFKDRLSTIEAAKEVGLEVCSGGIVGIGESWQDRLDMANLLKRLNVDSVPINFLIPIKGTPYEGLSQISPADAIRTVAIFRMVVKDTTIKVAAGRESLGDFQAMLFMAGANGMIIGGYLTVRGRNLQDDRRLIEEIEKIWYE